VDHSDHVNLLRGGVALPSSGMPPVWADVGAGTGAFTLALADLLGSGARIVAVDRDARALEQNQALMARAFPATNLALLVADFRRPLELPLLDGLVLANSLHFVARDQQAGVVTSLAGHLEPGGRLVLVEYDADRGNPWVPHPLSIRTWIRLSAQAGLGGTREIGRVPSRFLGAIYSAVSERSRSIPAD
jgi:SAM-dependent methyltransferase